MRQVEAAGVAHAAAVCAAALVAQQVAGKATRDALFLSTFDVSALPLMMTGAAVASLVVTLVLTPLVSGGGPARFLIRGLIVSVAFQAAAVAIAPRAPRVAAVAFYLFLGAVGPVLISAFWSAITERFDPHSAKRWVGRIAAGGTLGGLAGGLMAERVASQYGTSGVLVLLAALHALCAWRFHALALSAAEAVSESGREPLPSPRSVLADGYLRSMGLLMLAASAAGTLADYAFKHEAVAAIGGGPALLRFFAIFYTACGLIAFGTQALIARRSLERLGLARTASILPAALAGGGLGAALVPGFPVVVGLRAADSILRASLHRLAFELLYTPVAPRARRATKAVIDIGLDRLGEIAAASLLAIPALAAATPRVLAGVSALGFVSLAVARTLHGGYVRALERSLESRAVRIDATEVMDPATRRAVDTLAPDPDPSSAPLPAPPTIAGAADGFETGLLLLEWARPSAEIRPPNTPAAPRVVARASTDPVSDRWADLRSGDVLRVRAALVGAPLDALLVPAAIRLLAWDAVAGPAEAALERVAGGAVGQLVDALLDPDQEFAIRRRLPHILTSVASPRAADGLCRGLEDARFEVRFECARGLAARPAYEPGLAIDPETVFQAIRRETSVTRELWDSRRSAVPDGSAAARAGASGASRSLQHIFTLLSLVLSPQAVRLALVGVTGPDPQFRGIALEYLESALPDDVRHALWPFLDDDGTPPPPARDPRRPAESVLEELLLSDPAATRTTNRAGP